MFIQEEGALACEMHIMIKKIQEVSNLSTANPTGLSTEHSSHSHSLVGGQNSLGTYLFLRLILLEFLQHFEPIAA